MEKINTNKGFGLSAAIILIVVIGLGGFAAVQISKQIRGDVTLSEEEQNEEVMETKKEVISGLLKIKATLDSDISLNAKVDSALKIVADINKLLTESKTEVSGTARAEIEALQSQIASLEVKIESNANTASGDVSALINSIDASSDTNVNSSESNSNIDVNTGVDVNIDVDLGSSDSDETSTSTDDTNTDTEVEVEAGGSVEVGL